MIERLTIEGYRGFERFEMEGLGRINLLVGRNNSGKTSVLEALWLLATAEAEVEEGPAAAWVVAQRRDEVVAHHARLSHMFHQASAKDTLTRQIIFGERKAAAHYGIVAPRGLPIFEVRSAASKRLTGRRLADGDALERPGQVELFEKEGWSVLPIIGPELMERGVLIDLFGRVVLTPNEDRLMDALRLIDPRIQRLGSTGGEFSRLLVKVKGFPDRLPLGNLGGGVSRFAQLWLSFLVAERGPLLIDEIDTGLHHAVMIEMWRQIRQLAAERDIQVFATTHSWDCVAALGQMCALDGVADGDVTLQRIEAGKARAVRYDASEITMASDDGIEVR